MATTLTKIGGDDVESKNRSIDANDAKIATGDSAGDSAEAESDRNIRAWCDQRTYGVYNHTIATIFAFYCVNTASLLTYGINIWVIVMSFCMQFVTCAGVVFSTIENDAGALTEIPWGVWVLYGLGVVTTIGSVLMDVLVISHRLDDDDAPGVLPIYAYVFSAVSLICFVLTTIHLRETRRRLLK